MLLAPRAKAVEMCREGGRGVLPTRDALREFDRAQPRDFTQLRHFVASSRISHFDLRKHRDHEVLDFVRTCIRQGEMLVLRQGGASGKTVSEALELRRLIAQIHQQTRGRLSCRGRQYKLVLGDDLAWLPGRDDYEVVSQADAQRVLEGIAGEAGTPAELVTKADVIARAKEKLSKDWRPPSQPDGLLLLRRIRTIAPPPKNTGPAITPSQMKELIERETLELVFDTDVEEELELDFDTDAEEELVLEFATSPSGDEEESADEEGGALDESDMEEGSDDDERQSDEDDSDDDLEPEEVPDAEDTDDSAVSEADESDT